MEGIVEYLVVKLDAPVGVAPGDGHRVGVSPCLVLTSIVEAAMPWLVELFLYWVAKSDFVRQGV